MAGTIVADTLTHSTAGSLATNFIVEGSTKAWCSWDMANTGSPYDSFNVSSVTDDSGTVNTCLLYTSPSPRDRQKSRMPSSA